MERASMFTIVALLAAVGCSPSEEPPERTATSSAAVVGGEPDSGDPAVVPLVDEAGRVYCTASVVDARAAITAAHCFPGDGTRLWARVGSDKIALRSVYLPPAYDPGTFDDDVAIVTLARRVDVAPVGIVATPLPAAMTGGEARVVGFGSARADDLHAIGEKHTGRAQIEGLEARALVLGAAPTRACSGDSGGPVFATLEGVETLVGVTSHGPAECDGPWRAARIDTVRESFVAPRLRAIAATSVPLGGACEDDTSCASGMCHFPTSGGYGFCTKSCDGMDACPSTMTCGDVVPASKGRCLFPLARGAAGAACESRADCNGLLCVRVASDAGKVCAPACTPLQARTCGEGYVCRRAEGSDTAPFACTLRDKPSAPEPVRFAQTQQPGCSSAPVGRGAGADAPAGAIVFASLLAARRRARRAS